MAQSGYVPIQLYRSTTNGTAPNAANLLSGELAINTHASDMSLYAKNAAGTVKRLINNPSGLKYPTADGTANTVVKTNGSGTLSFGSVQASEAVYNNTTSGLTAVTVQGAIDELKALIDAL